MTTFWLDIIAWLPWSVLWLVWGSMTLIELYIVIKWDLEARANYVQPTSRSWDKKDPYANMGDAMVGICAFVIFIGGTVNWLYIVFLPIMLILTTIVLLFIYFITKWIVKFAPESDHAKSIVQFKEKYLTRKKKVKQVVDSK